MAKEYSRTERIADTVHKELTAIMHKEIADPRLRFITITSVKVTKDLSFADILFTQLDLGQLRDRQAKAMTVKLLKKAASRLRYSLAQRLKLRVTPRLRFFYDDLDDQSQHLYNLIDKSIAKDKVKRSD